MQTEGLRNEKQVRNAADLLAWSLAGELSPALTGALTALEWVLGDGAFGREVLGPLGKIRKKAEVNP